MTPRALDPIERELIEWLLNDAGSEARAYLAQVPEIRVVGGCPCGCASIDFEVGDRGKHSRAGLTILADYQWIAKGGYHLGVFVFAIEGVLAGLEVWSMDGTYPESVPLPPSTEVLSRL